MKKGLRLERVIGWVERAGNKLPHPFLLFVYTTLIVLVSAHLLSGTTFEVPGQVDKLEITTLLNAEGFRYILMNMVKNLLTFHLSA